MKDEIYNKKLFRNYSNAPTLFVTLTKRGRPKNLKDSDLKSYPGFCI